MSDGEHVMKGSSFYRSVRRLCGYFEESGAFSQRRDGDYVLVLYLFRKLEHFYRGTMVIIDIDI
jgi:hypothetical protein